MCRLKAEQGGDQRLQITHFGENLALVRLATDAVKHGNEDETAACLYVIEDLVPETLPQEPDAVQEETYALGKVFPMNAISPAMERSLPRQRDLLDDPAAAKPWGLEEPDELGPALFGGT